MTKHNVTADYSGLSILVHWVGAIGVIKHLVIDRDGVLMRVIKPLTGGR